MDQEGQLLRDFHTAHPENKHPYVTQRYYLCDAAFLVGLESDHGELLQQLEQALRSPAYPLFFGEKGMPSNTAYCSGHSTKQLAGFT